MQTSKIEVSAWKSFLASHPQIAGLDAFVIDINGHVIGKRLQAADAESAFAAGVQFSSCALFADARGLGHNVQGMGGSDGDPDGVAHALSHTLCMAPWTCAPTAQVQCQMLDAKTGKPYWFDPRQILAGVVERCREAGLRPVIACELEFYLVDPRRTLAGGLSPAAPASHSAPPRRAANLSLEAVESYASLLNQIDAAALAQGVPVCGSVAEYGIGQFEVNLRHVADPVLAADHAVLLKRIVKGVAQSQGMHATFMAKPFRAEPGNGLHVHLSLVDEHGINRFGASGGDELLRHAVAGMQAFMFDCVALFAPNVNSHRRFLGPFVPTSIDWGSNNRSVAFRVPLGGSAARRIEHRVASADASPHLVVAAILASVLHGVTHKLTATEPIEGRAAGARDMHFPRHQSAAISRLRASSILRDYFPAQFLDLYADVKEREHAALMQEILGAEYDFFL